MQYWTLWKHGPDRELSGEPAGHLVAYSDSLDALTRRGAQIAAQHHGDDSLKGEWIEWPKGSSRYRLGTERDAVYMAIEPDITPETVWVPESEARIPVGDPWLDEDVHSLR